MSPSVASVPIAVVLGVFGSFRLPQVIGSHFKDIRETWESHGKPGAALQMSPLLPGMGFRSGKLILGPGERAQNCLIPLALPHFRHDPVGPSISAPLHVPPSCSVLCQHPVHIDLTALTCPPASVYYYIWSLTDSFSVNSL